MKKLLPAIAVLVTACQQTQVSPSANIVGVRDMVRVGDYMFVTSSELDELRVLDLETGDTSVPRRYVRAPNPIQALSVPVLKRPTSLATDTHYEDVAYADGGVTPGMEVYGPYVYASSPGAPQISIVWGEEIETDHDLSLTELKRLATIAPVTAMAAVGTSVASAGSGGRIAGESTLYFATFDGTTTTLFSLKLQPPPGAAGQDVQSDVKVVSARTGGAIIDLLALPNGRLAVATRDANGRPGPASIIDATNGQQVVPLQFPAPVRALYTHGRADLGSEIVQPGGRIFGILDEQACGNVSCSGIVAVETATGLRSEDGPGRALPDCATAPAGAACADSPEQRYAPVLRFGDALVQSLGLTPGGMVYTPPSYNGSEPAAYLPTYLSVLGIATLSNGQIGVFEAGSLQQINSVGTGPTSVITGGTADAGIPEDGGFLPVRLSNGQSNDQVITAVGNGIIPGLGAQAATGNFISAPGAGTRAQVGDLVDGCSGSTVTSVEADGVRISPPCTANPVAVRAAGAQPYVVVGSLNGYLGRSGPGQTLSFNSDYFAHYVDYDPRRTAVVMTFPSTQVLGLEERYTIEIDDGFAPTAFSLTSLACPVGSTILPGAVIDDPIRQTFFVAYPSANGIIEINPSVVQRVAGLDRGFYCWR